MLTTFNFWAWAVQILLALVFAFTGGLKATQPLSRIQEMTGEWSKDYRPTTVRFIGWVEIAGALGMILPMTTGILPWLTPLAAVGFGIIQILAIPVHARHHELAKVLPVNLLLLALSLFVVWARWPLF